MTDVKLWLLYSNTWNHLTVWIAGLFKNVIYKICLQIIYIFNIYVYRGFGIKYPKMVDMP